MYQYSCLTASWSSSHYDIFRQFVADNLALAMRELAKKLVVFGRSDVLVYLCPPFFLEILVNEFAEV